MKIESMEMDDIKDANVIKGYLNSQINSVGCFPKVYLEVNEQSRQDVLEKTSSIFQIIPLKDEQYGCAVNLQLGGKQTMIGYTYLLLRHMLTGKYL